MADVINALQKSVYQALIGNVALMEMIGIAGIFDRRILGRPMPYLVFARIEDREIAPDAHEIIMVLEAWSNGEGRKEIQALAALVGDSLDDADLALETGALVGLARQLVVIKRFEKSKAFVAEMTFRAVVEI